MCARVILVYEKRPYWGPELKRQFLGDEIRVRAIRSLDVVESLLSTAPGSILVMDLRTGASECLQFVVRVAETAFPVQTVLIGFPGTENLEWVVRELGSDHFELESIRGEELARLCRRQLVR